MKNIFFELANFLSRLSSSKKIFLVVVIDGIICFVSTWLAFYLRIGDFNFKFTTVVNVSVISIILLFGPSYFYGLYRVAFRYFDFSVMPVAVKIFSTYTLFFIIIIGFIGVDFSPKTLGVIQPILLFLFLANSRVLAKYFFYYCTEPIKVDKNINGIIIYGCGSAGRQISSVINQSGYAKIVGFFDDDSRLWGRSIQNIRIYRPDDIQKLTKHLKASEIILAMPSASPQRRSELLSAIQEYKIQVKTLPDLVEIVTGRLSISDIRSPRIEDLLGRVPALPIDYLLKKNIVGKSVVITGAGGSIGSELCEQVINLQPQTLILIDHGEHALHTIYEKLIAYKLDVNVVPFLTSVKNEARISQIFEIYKPHIIFHAAAYKHVALVEHNTLQAVENNVFGTMSLAKCSLKAKVKNFVLISTDKAVNPTNVMGATKRFCELIVQALFKSSQETLFTIVRFGNVLGSSGSVVPIFKEQIQKRVDITLTHKDVVRYFMTIPEAAQLVIQASSIAQGGEIFILDMGQPIKISDLAKKMVNLSGLSLRGDDGIGDIGIKYIGLRPGEKLYEELTISGSLADTIHPKIMKTIEEFFSWDELEMRLSDLRKSVDSADISAVTDIFKKTISGYKPPATIVDYIYNGK